MAQIYDPSIQAYRPMSASEQAVYGVGASATVGGPRGGQTSLSDMKARLAVGPGSSASRGEAPNPPQGDPMGGVGQAAPVLLSFARLVARFGQQTAIAIWGVLRPLAGQGGAAWARMPEWVKASLVIMGLQVGQNLILDTDGPGPDTGLVPVGGVGGGAIQGLNVNIVGSWQANGRTFYRLADGRLATQNKRGKWKLWRPRRPIVLYPDGASNLRTMLRADKALNKQGKKIVAFLGRRGGGKGKKGKTTNVYLERGPGDLVKT